MSDPEAPPGHRLSWVWLAAALVAVLRLVALDADPSPRLRDPVVMDEGLWAGSARGKVLFDDYFAEDHGEGYLIAPLYTHILTGIYGLLGVGLWQTRLLAALTGAGALLLLGRWLAVRSGTKAGVLVVVLGGVTQLLDQHSRIALLEMPETFFVTAAFVLLFSRTIGVRGAFGAGLAMAAALAIKPNAVDFGIMPLGCAYLCQLRIDMRAGEQRTWIRRGAAAIAGGMVGLAVFAVPVWSSHWSAFMAAVRSESGIAYYSLAEHLFRLAHPGTWTPIRDAPAVLVGAWCWLVLRPARSAHRDRRQPQADHGPLLVWFLVSLAMCEVSFMPVPRRYVLAMLPACGIAAAFLAHRRRHVVAEAVSARHRLAASLALVLLPAVLIKKPFQELIQHALPALAIKGLPVIQMAHEDACSYLATWIWILALLGAAAVLYRLPAVQDGLRILVRRFGPAGVVALAVFEAAHLGCLPPHSRSMLAATDSLAATIPRGSTVVGMFAATLLLPLEIRTAWRILPGRLYSTPPPNPDAVHRLGAQYILDGADTYREMADVTASGYRSLQQIQLLPTEQGPRIVLQLWKAE